MITSDVRTVSSGIITQHKEVSLMEAFARAERAEQGRDIERWMRLRLESAVKRHLELQKQLQQLQNRRIDKHHIVISDYVANVGARTESLECI